MKSYKRILYAIVILLGYYTNAQDLSTHQWQKRILLIITDDTNTLEFQNQIQELQNEIQGLNERQLLVYQITPTSYSLGISKEQHWISTSMLYNDFKTNNTSFEILLIGLDGNIKLRQHSVLTPKELFNIIDAMPMRRSEIKRNRRSKN